MTPADMAPADQMGLAVIFLQGLAFFWAVAIAVATKEFLEWRHEP